MLKNTIKKIIVAIADSLTVRNFVIFANIDFFLILALLINTDHDIDTDIEERILRIVTVLIICPIWAGALLIIAGAGRRLEHVLVYLFGEALCIMAAFAIYTAAVTLLPL